MREMLRDKARRLGAPHVSILTVPVRRFHRPIATVGLPTVPERA